MLCIRSEKEIPFSRYNLSIKRKESLDLVSNLVKAGVFRKISIADRSLIERYIKNNSFADLTFSMLWAWDGTYNYCLRDFGNAVFIIGVGIDDTVDCFLLSHEDAEVDECVKNIYDEFTSRGYELRFENVSDKDIKRFESAAEYIRKKPEVKYDRDFSDYVYKLDNFLNLSGNANKGKRSKYNNFVRNHPDAQYIRYEKSKYGDLVYIFDKWCGMHSCNNCKYGCEYNAFIRLLELYQEDERTLIGMTYENGEPLSFAVAEFINSNEVSFYIQKNAQRITGLTYFLEKKMLEDMNGVELVNMGEDMGVEGLRIDKEGYHPDYMSHKYSISFKK